MFSTKQNINYFLILPLNNHFMNNTCGLQRRWNLISHIRIFNGCKVQTENSVTRVTVQHYEARWVMPNSYLEWRNFQFTPNSHYGFFFLLTLQQQHSSLHTGYFVSFTPKYLHFRSRNIWFRSHLQCWHPDICRKRHPNVMRESRLTPPHASPGCVCGNPRRVCKQIYFCMC